MQGAHAIVDQRPEWLEGCTEGIGEVGGFSTTVAGKRIYLIETAEKGIAWLRLRAHGTAGHGSMRNTDNAVTAISEAVASIGRHEWPVRLTPAMGALLEEVARLTGHDNVEDNVDALVEALRPGRPDAGRRRPQHRQPDDAGVGLQAQRDPGRGHRQHRRPLPAGLRGRVLRHPAGAAAGQRHATSCWCTRRRSRRPFDGPLVDAMVASLHSEDPDAIVLPFLMSGGTDAKAWNRLGIRCFGFSPLRLPPDLDFTGLFHGVDERVPLDALEFSARVFDDFLDRA